MVQLLSFHSARASADAEWLESRKSQIAGVFDFFSYVLFKILRRPSSPRCFLFCKPPNCDESSLRSRDYPPESPILLISHLPRADVQPLARYCKEVHATPFLNKGSDGKVNSSQSILLKSYFLKVSLARVSFFFPNKANLSILLTKKWNNIYVFRKRFFYNEHFKT